MKSISFAKLFCVALISIFLGLSAPAHAEMQATLNAALDMIHQAWNPGGDPLPDAQRTDLLNKAIALLHEPPDKHAKIPKDLVKLHKKIIGEINDALDALQKGDPDHKVDGYLHDADEDIRTVLSELE